MSPLDLLGTWRLERRIDDRSAGQVLHLTGATELVRHDLDQVDWSERGVLRRPGAAPVEVTRRLHVVRRDAGWWVCFDHGGDFHPWAPGTPVEHPCGPDLYRGLVEASPTCWSTIWDVTGPVKDHRITSRLTRPT